MTFLRYLPHINAGFVSLLIGYCSSAVLVFEAAKVLGANETQITSWFWALGIGIGLMTIGLSLLTKMPVVIAWSTPGAALIISIGYDFSLNDAIGAFVICAVMIVIVGFSGLFKTLMSYVPSSLAAAVLAGILIKFGLDVFVVMEQHTTMVLLLIGTYLVFLAKFPKFSVAAALIVGIVYSLFLGDFRFSDIRLEFALPTYIAPTFSITAFVSLALPLFVITMASQNLPGAALMKSYGYKVDDSKVIGITGTGSLVLSTLGGFCFNYAAIMAAICVSEDAEPDPKQRYLSAICSGVFYLIAGVFASSIVSLFLAFPQQLVTAIAGIALLSVINASLTKAIEDEENRLANLCAFLMVASGISLYGVSGAFWGLLLGLFIRRIT